MEKSKVIFGNIMPEKIIKKAEKNKQHYIKKYGDDSNTPYHLSAVKVPAIGDVLGVNNLVISDKSEVAFDEKSVIIGNIRMGFGHYRISMAIASAAKSIGYNPYWFDLHSFQNTTCGKIIAQQNKLYSLGSRLSQQSFFFNKLFWEPLNSEGFRKLTYNANDQKTAELMTSVFNDLPKDIPFLATHVWPAQAAVHAGLTKVVNVIPDNWPMALHLSQGAIHTVQTPSAYLGYRVLRGMDKKKFLNPIPENEIQYTGHYVDHELVANIEKDCKKRIERVKNKDARRWLMSIGGAGAQKEIFAAVIKKLIPEIKKNNAVLFINLGDHKNVWKELVKAVPIIKDMAQLHFDNYTETETFCNNNYENSPTGIHVFSHSDIFEAVYSTNLLMRIADILITKPSELSFYPIPKLMIKRVGGHEAWGAIRAAEIGDGTYECSTLQETAAMLSVLQNDGDVLEKMCNYITEANKTGIYNGAYNAVKLAVKNNS